MALIGAQTYIGFGLGAIQAGLFLYEASQSGAFRRLVAAEVQTDVIAAIRRSAGRLRLNIAHADGVERATIGPVEVWDPASETGRERLIHAVADAHEIGTAVPSVAYYVSHGPGSVHRILAEGLRMKAARGGPRAVIYVAEIHHHAAELLESKVLAEIPEEEQAAVRTRCQFLQTVIGKMSGVVSSPREIQAQGLATVTPNLPRAFLVEAFNRILISRIRFADTAGEPPYRRGIEVFEEKDKLLPFEEAKLYGHNATHALAAYLGAVRGVERIADLRDTPGVLPFLRAAFLEESGEALVRRHAGVDPVFTTEGYQEFVDDLLERMTNPYLLDTVERVGRDPARKLGWDDRLIGTIRMALREGVEPRRYAVGAAAALATMDRAALREGASIEAWLNPLWRGTETGQSEREAVLALIADGLCHVRRWQQSGFQDLLLLP